jgi:hypothetical protein
MGNTPWKTFYCGAAEACEGECRSEIRRLVCLSGLKLATARWLYAFSYADIV